MEAPCKSHNRSLQSLRAIVPTPPPAFKTEFPALLSRKSFTPPPTFCGFRFCERTSLALNQDCISILRPNAPNEKRKTLDFQTFQPQQSNSHRIFALRTDFGARGTKWCGAERS
ncbi:hypothetical protein AVEN_178748-1 [Araneus ventricosus]|uniref:Uncharacterized protein n=1 Tax=Araneus ventricosus TaxID=182803 RepID=A0A4Y2I1L2_ARAVE|nr:hypothetical protein AVEN_178748-1 [Araneus ventricosus]